MPLIFKDGYYKPVEKDLQKYFHDLYWNDILIMIKDPNPLYNSQSALIAAIRSGKIQYKNGVFSGTFNSKISGALSRFAKFDKKTKTWKGIPPSPVASAATIANIRGEDLNRRLKDLIARIPARVENAIDSLKYQIEAPLFAMNQEADKDIVSLGLKPNESPALNKRIVDNYTTNMNINIQNWTPQQTEKLRDMVERNVMQGYNRGELIKMISSEYDVSMTKATFLARQETGLLMAEVRNERYEDAGIELYKWSTSGDIRVVGTPGGLYPEGTPGHGNHFVMQGKICKMSDSSVYADNIAAARRGEWKSKLSIGADNTHPGQAYQDRCSMIPIIS